MDLINRFASCCCSVVAARLCVGVDVATSGRASADRATCVRIGGMLFVAFVFQPKLRLSNNVAKAILAASNCGEALYVLIVAVKRTAVVIYVMQTQPPWCWRSSSLSFEFSACDVVGLNSTRTYKTHPQRIRNI
jgi:hypothetical protein